MTQEMTKIMNAIHLLEREALNSPGTIREVYASVLGDEVYIMARGVAGSCWVLAYACGGWHYVTDTQVSWGAVLRRMEDSRHTYIHLGGRQCHTQTS